MISISKIISSLLVVLLFLGGVALVQAQSNVVQTISVSPTLFDISASPGQVWKSEIRVINVNDYDLTVYPQVVNFAPLGETGRIDLIPVFESETDGQTLAEWITINTSAVTIPKQQTVSVPFSVLVPEGASPGGHNAAILIGTRPATDLTTAASRVQTAQFVTSLFFLKVAGEVVEVGSIREFRAADSLVPSAAVDLQMRFENKGNVHLQPQGDIHIYNMWGEERGVIPINHQTHFGKVLRESIREFTFSWKGDISTFDIGRYKAVATLGYGNEEKRFVDATTYFWIVPFQQIFILLAILLTVFFFLSWIVRLYIRRMLYLAGVNPMNFAKESTKSVARNVGKYDFSGQKTVIISRYQTMSGPVRFGVADFFKRLQMARASKQYMKAGYSFVNAYRNFFLALGGLLLVALLVGIYLATVRNEVSQYEVIISNSDTPVKISSEEIKYNALKTEQPSTSTTPVTDQSFTLNITNVSGVVGVAASLRITLEGLGYMVTNLDTDLDRQDRKTVIVYDAKLASEALELSKQLGGVLLSVAESVDTNEIHIFAGADFISQ